MVLNIYSSDRKNHLKKEPSLLSAEPKFYIKMPSGEEAPVFDFKDFPFEIFNDAPVYTKRGKTLDRIQYLDLACAFDIETTTILEDEPYAFMYQWQFCIEDYVFMGKTWEEFQEFYHIVSSKLDLTISLNDKTLSGRSLVVYVHNLNYEFQFMRFFIEPIISPMVTDKYCPLIIPTGFGFTFRCSYRLTNKSLDAFTKGFPHSKLKGDLDYDVIRTPKTKMTDTELAYCYNDVKGLCEALRDRLEKDKYNIASIPLTSTGYVRKDCQQSMNKTPKNHKRFIETQLDAHLYKMCRAAFRGGNTHANAAHVGQVLHQVKSWDLASSYPAWILTKTYPIGKFNKIDDPSGLITNFNNIIKQWCLLVTIRIYDFKYIGSCGVPYIAKAKTFLRLSDKDQIVEDNGRIVSAPFAELTLTDIDLLMVLKYYRFAHIEIVEAYRSHRGMLPNELRRVCMDYYTKKTQLKGLTSEDGSIEYEYARAKEQLNSTYGMMVQRVDHIEYQYEDGDYKVVNKPLQELLDKFYKSKSSFLPYQYGVWVTAWARFVLQMGLDIAGSDMVYCDTDSVKYIGDHEAQFRSLNEYLRDNALKAGAVAYNNQGHEYPVGIFDQEKTYTEFKTLGAKKYIYSYDNGKTIHSTISGVAKDIGAKFFTEHGFKAFTDKTVIPVSGKVSARYNNDLPHYIEVNGERILTASNIALVPAAYTIHITHDYHDFIESVKNSLNKYYK